VPLAPTPAAVRVLLAELLLLLLYCLLCCLISLSLTSVGALLHALAVVVKAWRTKQAKREALQGSLAAFCLPLDRVTSL
jgi:hypothetical protein